MRNPSGQFTSLAEKGVVARPTFFVGSDDHDGVSHAKHEEELWIFSYADLITNLLLFFLMMFAISKIDDDMLEVISAATKDEKAQPAKPKAQSESSDKEQPTLTEEQLAMINSMSGSERNSQIVKQMQVLISRVDEKALQEDEEKKKAFEKMKENLKKVAEFTQDLTKGMETLNLRVPGERVFPPGKETPLPEAQSFLSQVARELTVYPGKFSLVVEGHTDATETLVRPTPLPGKTPAPTSLDKWELSSRRAAAVLELLKSKGVKPGTASIAGYADTRPIVPERDAGGKIDLKAQSLNRRVDIKILREPSNVPGLTGASPGGAP